MNRILALLLMAGWVAAAGAAAQPVGCNLAPNPAFERGVPSAIESWGLARLSGTATLAVSNYPEPAQSGARAARVDVQESGDISLRTAEPGNISVLPGTSYRLSARLRSEPGKTAGIRVVEWNHRRGTVADRFLAFNAGTGDWETVEGTFTTTEATAFLSIRLMHHVHAGTFYWDDVLLSLERPGERCMDIRHYLMQTTPGFKMCLDNRPGFCHDGVKLPSGEFLREQPLARDYLSHTLRSGAMVGVIKNFDAEYGAWRCFTDPGDPCDAVLAAEGENPRFPPMPLGVSIPLPVLASMGSDRVTPGAALLHDWQPFDVRNFKPDWTSGPRIGTIRHRTWAYLLASHTFTGNLGIHDNVLVIETESGGDVVRAPGVGGGSRLERYIFVRGIGLAYAEGREAPDCGASPGAATCNGAYAKIHPAAARFTLKTPGDYPFSTDHPPSYNVVDWW